MQRFFINFKESIISIRVHKLRSLLAILGVVIGVAAVIAVVSFGEGNRHQIQEAIERLGADTFWIYMQYRSSSDIRDNQATVNPQAITVDDIRALDKYATRIDKIAPYHSFDREVLLNARDYEAQIIGTVPEIKHIFDLQLICGRFLTESDIKFRRRVCVPEYAYEQQKYLIRGNPLKAFVMIDGLKYRIVGLVKKYESGLFYTDTGKIYVPITASPDNPGVMKTRMLFCRAVGNQMESALRQAKAVFTSRYQGAEVVHVQNMAEYYESARKMSRTASLVTAGIAMISLIVGCIGIMNIMLVSVTERTREIGIRKCLGAKNRDIRNQFLVESILLTSIGGLAGVALGGFLSQMIASLLEIPTVFSLLAAITGLGFSVGIGILSGFYPAFKASGLNPIEALRYE